uniref:Uncharacterized protein n=1 Tax=Vitis vinifera TaxID=29760 RepID=F6GVU2_VITVI
MASALVAVRDFQVESEWGLKWR